MQLILDTIRHTLRDTEYDKYDFGRFYPMPDGEHKFIVRELGNFYLVEIRKGKKTVQSARVHRLSVTAGQPLNGDPRRRPYTLTLDPAQPIFPISDLVEKLMAMGVKSSHISPMFDPTLSDCTASHSSPQMVSDGTVSRWEHPAGDGLFAASEFMVDDANWAISSWGEPDRHLHIYLWMGAAQDPETVLDAVRRVKASELTPEYV